MRSSQSIMQCEIDATIYFSVLSSPHLPIANLTSTFRSNCWNSNNCSTVFHTWCEVKNAFIKKTNNFRLKPSLPQLGASEENRLHALPKSNWSLLRLRYRTNYDGGVKNHRVHFTFH